MIEKFLFSPTIHSRYQKQPSTVFGRVLTKEPVARFRDSPARERHYDDISRMYIAADSKNNNVQPRRRGHHFKIGSSGGGSSSQPNMIPAQRGSFNRLKELIGTERAKELAQQRMQEEIAARAAVLKEITNGEG